MEKTWSSREQNIFFDVLRDYRAGNLDSTFYYCRDYSNPSFWILLTEEYNRMANEQDKGPVTVEELIMFGRKLENDFLKQRKNGNTHISSILAELFLPCTSCEHKIPVFSSNKALKELGFKPAQSRSRSKSRSRSQSRSGSGIGARNLAPSAESARISDVEISDSRSKLVTKIKGFASRNEITLSEMIKLLDVFNKWEENACWSTLLLSADTDEQFVEYMKAILKHLGPN